MKILNTNEANQLKQLAKMESDLINLGFNKSNELGLVFLSNSLTSFKEDYLQKIYGNIIPGMCSEYRIFVVELIKLISDDYKDISLSELLIPKIKEFKDNELLALLR